MVSRCHLLENNFSTININRSQISFQLTLISSCMYPNSTIWTGLRIGLTIYLCSGPGISYYGLIHPNHSIASLYPSVHPYSPLCVIHSQVSLVCSLSLSLTFFFFSPKILTPHFSFSSFFYSFMLVEVSWLFPKLTRVGGVQSNYSWWKYALIKTVIMALELTPASKRLPSSDVP